MTNNDILRRLRYIFDYGDAKMGAIFASGGYEVTRDQVRGWLKNEEDPIFLSCNDKQLAVFLNGLINEKRGQREGEQPVPEKRLTNNMILMKLKIALNLKAEDILAILELVDFDLSKHELSAFFRKSDHQHFRKCKDQVIRRFLMGMQFKYRDENKPKQEARHEEARFEKPWSEKTESEKPRSKETKQKQAAKPKESKPKEARQSAPKKSSDEITQADIWKK